MRIEREFAKDRANLAKGDGGLIELEINQVVAAIDLVVQTRNRGQLMVELQDLLQIAKTGGVNFQFQHLASNFTDSAARCKKKRGIARVVELSRCRS